MEAFRHIDHAFLPWGSDTIGDGALARILAASMDLAYEWDLLSDNVRWFGPTDEFFGERLKTRIALGKSYSELVSSEDAAQRRTALEEHYRTSGSLYECEYRLHMANGSFRWVHDKGRVEISADGEPRRMRGIIRMIEQRKQQEGHLAYAASFDNLTGHYNRERLHSALQEIITQSERYSSAGGYLCIGIDRMSLINEGYGHEAADEAIIGAGKRLENLLRNSDLLGRMGGDVFGIILQSCSDDHMPKVAEKILASFRESPIETPQGAFHFTVSIGGIVFPMNGIGASDVMTRAESALHAAKLQGRDRFVPWEDETFQHDVQRGYVEMGEQTLQALKDGRLLLAYQPVVDATTGTPTFYEALLRMIGEDKQIIGAGDFIPAIERLGLSRTIDRYVLDMSVRELEESPDLSIAMNISGITVSDGSWLEHLVELVGTRPEIAKRLIVEITETVAMSDMGISMAFSRRLHELGCQVSIDDFGVGYTSFRHIRTLDPDIVKIDGSYILNMPKSRHDELFVHTLQELAQGMNIKTVAECVENADVAQKLVRQGVTLLQGYYFGYPKIEKTWMAGKSVPCFS
ncbi:MAG TPA: hypothetical protein DCW68_04470 [Rhodospirillaceae bacterium]|nr:MAG: hypothetical protein A2018_03180 [Alphaproteobacteria bacterium GWF2_58_20]HAU29351.1 hypothetical protein [Rhodospirillaceae bacterium]